MPFDTFVSVDRTFLALSPLTITDTTAGTTPYVLQRSGIGPGALTYRRWTVTSPFVHGRFLVNAVKDAASTTLKFWVRGADTDWLDYNTAVLQDAFAQYSYTFTHNLNGVIHTYGGCEPADRAVGDNGSWEDLQVRSLVQQVTFTVWHSPIPLAGRY